VLREGEGVVDFRGDRTGAQQDVLAERGHRQLAGGPLQELFAKAAFEAGYPARNRGLGQPETFRGPAEAARFHDSGKEKKVFGIGVHGSIVPPKQQ